jgi:hypothetical protein
MRLHGNRFISLVWMAPVLDATSGPATPSARPLKADEKIYSSTVTNVQEIVNR